MLAGLRISLPRIWPNVRKRVQTNDVSWLGLIFFDHFKGRPCTYLGVSTDTQLTRRIRTMLEIASIAMAGVAILLSLYTFVQSKEYRQKQVEFGKRLDALTKKQLEEFEDRELAKTKADIWIELYKDVMCLGNHGPGIARLNDLQQLTVSQRRAVFEQASNAIFLPPEYASSNCCIPAPGGCWWWMGSPCNCWQWADEDSPLCWPCMPPPCPSDLDITAPSANFTFLGNDTIQAATSTSPSSFESAVVWPDPFPTIGSVINISPSSQNGPNLSFGLSVPARTSGSLGANAPLTVVIASLVLGCTASDQVTISQDERDIIRQEFLEYSITVPSNLMTKSASSAGTNFSVLDVSEADYSLVVGDPGQFMQNIRSSWNQKLKTELSNPNFPDQGLEGTGGWRNPQRNKYVGGHPNSQHMYGTGADLQVLAGTITASGQSLAQLNSWLKAVGDAIGTGICEDGPISTPCNDPGVDHVHIQL